MNIKTVYNLRHALECKAYLEHGDHDHYSNWFSPSNMRFFSDTMRNFGMRKVTIVADDGTSHVCHQVYRKSPVRVCRGIYEWEGSDRLTYNWDVGTLEMVHEKQEVMA